MAGMKKFPPIRGAKLAPMPAGMKKKAPPFAGPPTKGKAMKKGCK